MTGYTIKKILPSELILGRSKFPVFLLILILIGITFITLSILTKYKIINPPDTFFSLFLGMGIIFTAAGIIFMIQKIPDSISFNRDKSSIIFSENRQQYSIPFADFNKLMITGKLHRSRNSSYIIYQLNLISSSQASILLSESGVKSDLQKTAESIIPYLDIDLLSGADLLHKGAGSYIPADPVYPPLNILNVKISAAGDTAVYRWNCRKALSSVILLGAVISGFNFVFFSCAYPAINKYNTGLYAVSAVFALIDIFFAYTLIFDILGSNTVEVSDSSFSYRQRIFGFNISSRVFNRDQIGMIRCGFTSDENKITIYSRRGIEVFNEMKVFADMNDLDNQSRMLSIIPKVMELRKNIIEIDGSPLYYYEKLYLEHEWSEKLKLENNLQYIV